MTELDFPYRFDWRGRTASTDHPDHVRDLVEQLLFTGPGERVNRPSFGTGLPQLVFEPASPDLAAATELLIQGALQQYLGDLIAVESVTVGSEEGELDVAVTYALKATGARQVERFTRPEA
jgi:phage baseplate assembly protein W